MSRLTLRSELDASELDAALDLRRALPTSSRVDILERARDALAHAREHQRHSYAFGTRVSSSQW